MRETEHSNQVSVGGVLGVLGLVAALSVGAIALGSSTPAAAEGLERFESCAALQAWSGEVAPMPGVAVDDGAGSAPAPLAADAAASASAGTSASASAERATADTGGTNTVVEGVDEIDVIDQVDDDRLLVSRNGVLSLVDLTARTVLAEVGGVPYDARSSVAGDLVWIAGSSVDGRGTEVRRVRIDGDTLVEDGTWRTPGYLIDARRTGDTLHVVAVDHPSIGAAPFAGGPVPCEDVWRPVAPSPELAATLIASLPADGPLEPVAAAEVTGSAGNLLVTDTAAYVTTPSWSADGGASTGIHRFDLAGLTLTGSGVVPGMVAGPFALDEHDGHLRVATNAGGGFAVPVDGDVAVAVDVAADVARPEAPVPGTGGNALAEVFVLDLDGDLDVVGDSGRFGHDGETIQGVRFVGDTAYVVTFLQTDPFWVLDLADPSAPQVVGELQIPGFSGYLHPVGDGEVVGIGPDGTGSASVRLFDVADPQHPSVLDEVQLGDDSLAGYDHHAFVGLGDGHFAVPFTEYPTYVDVGGAECVRRELPPEAAAGSSAPGVAVGEPVPSCVPQAVGGAVGVVELAVSGGQLVEVERATVERPDANAERVVRAGDGPWLLLSWDRLIPTDGGPDLVLPQP